MSWQWVCVIAIELGAFGYLAAKLVLPRRPARARPRSAPDVPVSALVRRRTKS